MLKNNYFTPLALLAACTSTSFAGIIVDMNHTGQKYVPSFTAFVNDGGGLAVSDFSGDGTNDYIRSRRYSNPTTTAYLGTDGETVPGYTFDAFTSVANIRESVFPPAPGSSVHFGGQGFTKGSLRFRSVSSKSTTTYMGTASWLIFQQGSWDSLSSEVAVMDGSSLFSTNISNIGNQTLRFMVVADGNYYVSEATDSGSNTTFELGNLANQTFYSYSNAVDSSGAILFDSASESSLLGSSLFNISGVGLYSSKVGFDGTSFTNDASIDWNMSSFRAELSSAAVTPVPEPSTYALIAGLLTLAVVIVRRKKRS